MYEICHAVQELVREQLSSGTGMHVHTHVEVHDSIVIIWVDIADEYDIYGPATAQRSEYCLSDCDFLYKIRADVNMYIEMIESQDFIQWYRDHVAMDRNDVAGPR